MGAINGKSVPVITIPAVDKEKNISQILLSGVKEKFNFHLDSTEAKVLIAAGAKNTPVMIRYAETLPDGSVKATEVATLVSVDGFEFFDDENASFTLKAESQAKLSNVNEKGKTLDDQGNLVSDVTTADVAPYENLSLNSFSRGEQNQIRKILKAQWGQITSAQAQDGTIDIHLANEIQMLINHSPIEAYNKIAYEYGRHEGGGNYEITRFKQLLTNSDNTGEYLYHMVASVKDLVINHVEGNAKAEAEVVKEQKEEYENAQKQYQLMMRKQTLHKQLQEVNAELNGGKPAEEEPAEKYARLLEEKEAAGVLPEKVAKKCRTNLGKLGSPSEAEKAETFLRGMLEDFPFGQDIEDRPTPDEARDLLNEGHYGQDDVKNMILDYIMVELYKAEMGDPHYKGKPILLDGAPGIGKTTLAKSIAKATGRKFAVIACGGVSDTKVFEGHGPAYVGSKHGAIIQAFMDAGTEAPLLLLDEIDKIEKGINGDPSAILMQLTDPSQNDRFRDKHFDVELDLSKARIIATSNYLHKVDPVLLDRFKVIRLDGYSLDEKIEIIKGFVKPSEMEGAGLTDEAFTLSDDAVKFMIENYTNISSPGVRTLEELVQTVCRKAVREIVQNGATHVNITPELLQQKEWLGEPTVREPNVPQEDTVGWTTALAYSAVGGSAFPIKAELVRSVTPEKGEAPVIRNKELGDSMQYSIDSVAAIYKDLLDKIKLTDEFNEEARASFVQKLRTEYHVHADVTVDGPVDGPSAGVTFTTAIMSKLLNMPIDCKVAMTGKVDPRGNVLAIGGLEQKIPAARVAGMTKVIIPEQNRKDFERLKDDQKAGVDVVFASTIEDVLKHAIPGIGNVIDFNPNSDDKLKHPADGLHASFNKAKSTANDNNQVKAVKKAGVQNKPS